MLVGTFAAWFVLNISLNYYNSRVLRGTNFHFPFLLTLVNKLVGFIIAVTLMLCSKGLPNPQELGAHFLRPIVHVQGVATALNIGFNNWSLVEITLTMNQILKSTAPLWTAPLSMIFEGKTFSWQLWGSMSVLVVGCVMAAWGALADEPILGILLCLLSVLSQATWTVSSAVLMQMGEKPLDAVSLLFVSGPTCMLTLFIFFAFRELPLISDPDSFHDVPPAYMMCIYLGVAASLASCYDFVHNHFVKLTSSVNMAIMGNTKLAVLIGLSMATMESPPTVLRVLGVVVAFLGVIWYAWFSLQPKPPAPVADEKTGTQGDEKTQPLKPTEATELLKKDDEKPKSFIGGLFGGSKQAADDKV